LIVSFIQALFGDARGPAMPNCTIGQSEIIFLMESCTICVMNIFFEPDGIISRNQKHEFMLNVWEYSL